MSFKKENQNSKTFYNKKLQLLLNKNILKEKVPNRYENKNSELN